MFRLGEDRMTLARLIDLLDGRDRPALSDERRRLLARRRQALLERMARGEVVYGVNTGFGRLKDQRIPEDRLRELQVRLVRSHAAGTGEPLPPTVVRAMLLLRAHTLALGHSAVRPELIEHLLGCFEVGLVPWVPAQGSVGASGDLAPLAHMVLALMGEGACWVDGRPHPAREVLSAHGITPLSLEPREGIALINGTTASTALLAVALHRAFENLALADLAGAMTLDAAQGSVHPMDPPVYETRPYPAFRVVARQVRVWLEGSEILEHHRACGKIQDNYSLRCMLQVHGTVLEALRFIQGVLETEMNSVTDNPVFLEDGTPVYNGNFHGAPVAMAADLLATVMTTLSAISERRVFHLMTPEMSGLPAFLTPEPGLNSGFMLLQVTAAALVSESKTLAHPASVDTIPTSGNQEDHVSMSLWAARKALQVVENTRRVLTIELMAAAQGIDLRRPLRSGPRIEAVLARFRQAVPFRAEDAVAAEDLARAEAWVEAQLRQPPLRDEVEAVMVRDAG
ncbi:Histidine ammonia-lyase [bacterium HR11]|nr:Histidine ammonia-lyase [bacterium HR11]